MSSNCGKIKIAKLPVTAWLLIFWGLVLLAAALLLLPKSKRTTQTVDASSPDGITTTVSPENGSPTVRVET